MNLDELVQAAPDGINCVTVVTSAPSNLPTVILSQFMEDENGNWRVTGEPIILPASQLPELINQLEGVISGAKAEAKTDLNTQPHT
jgi:hypothetical protein